MASNDILKNLLVFLFVVFLSIGFTIADAQEVYVAKYKGDKTCAISYTFDDGLAEHYTLVAPYLEKLGFKGTFWVNGAKINDNMVKDTSRMSWSQLRHMATYGHEISSHGYSHRNLTKISFQEAKEEIEKNDSIIFEKLGILPTTFCYPYNAKTEEIIRLASKNRIGTRTKQFSMGSKSTHENLQARINSLLRDKDWGVAMVHGITYGYDIFSDTSILWRHLDQVAKMTDSIWIDTFHKIAAYISERDNIRLEVTHSENRKFTIIPHLDLDYKLFLEPLTVVIVQKGIDSVFVKQGKRQLDVRLLEDKAIFDFDPFGSPIEVDLF